MKQYYSFIFICLFILSIPACINGQDKKAAKHNLKTVTVTEQKYDKGAPGKPVIESETRYDNSGNVTEEMEYKLGKMVKHMVYQYDSDNNKIRETELDAGGKKVKVTEYKYSDGLRTEKTVYDASNKILSRKVYKYETY